MLGWRRVFSKEAQQECLWDGTFVAQEVPGDWSRTPEISRNPDLRARVCWGPGRIWNPAEPLVLESMQGAQHQAVPTGRQAQEKKAVGLTTYRSGGRGGSCSLEVTVLVKETTGLGRLQSYTAERKTQVMQNGLHSCWFFPAEHSNYNQYVINSSEACPHQIISSFKSCWHWNQGPNLSPASSQHWALPPRQAPQMCISLPVKFRCWGHLPPGVAG